MLFDLHCFNALLYLLDLNATFYDFDFSNIFYVTFL